MKNLYIYIVELSACPVETAYSDFHPQWWLQSALYVSCYLILQDFSCYMLLDLHSSV